MRILGWPKAFTITGADGSPYMTRYYLFRSRWLSIYLHHIHRSDEDDLHDHPWSFVSVILRGGYWEKLPGSGLGKFHGPGSVIFHKAEDAHQIVLNSVLYGCGEDGDWIPAWTLVFTGPKRREWGFHTKTGWVQWREYMDQKFGKGNWTPV